MTRNASGARLLCSKRRWIGRLPECRFAGDVEASCGRLGCEHLCRIVQGKAACLCREGFRIDGPRCIGKRIKLIENLELYLASGKEVSALPLSASLPLCLCPTVSDAPFLSARLLFGKCGKPLPDMLGRCSRDRFLRPHIDRPSALPFTFYSLLFICL
jgi:hypothetical protein